MLLLFVSLHLFHPIPHTNRKTIDEVERTLTIKWWVMMSWMFLFYIFFSPLRSRPRWLHIINYLLLFDIFFRWASGSRKLASCIFHSVNALNFCDSLCLWPIYISEFFISSSSSSFAFFFFLFFSGETNHCTMDTLWLYISKRMGWMDGNDMTITVVLMTSDRLPLQFNRFAEKHEGRESTNRVENSDGFVRAMEEAHSTHIHKTNKRARNRSKRFKCIEEIE